MAKTTKIGDRLDNVKAVHKPEAYRYVRPTMRKTNSSAERRFDELKKRAS